MKNTPSFNLKAVIKMTGLSADTLRAWERRYGLPEPQRTPGGQRVYSQRDIDIIRWLTAKQSEGLSISHCVGLWKELVQNGSDPVSDTRTNLSTQLNGLDRVEKDNSLSTLRKHWKQACLDFNDKLADQVANQAFAIASPESVCTEIFLKGLSELGDSWFQGKVTVQQEHFASGLAFRRLGSLISSTPPSNRNETILMCCPPGEEHNIPTTYLTFCLRRRGYHAIDLGANTPIADLKETVLKVHPQLVVMSAQKLSGAAQIRRSALALANTTIIGFGGSVFNTSPSLITSIPAFFLGDSLEAAPGIIENILHNPPVSATDEMKNPYQNLHELFEIKLQTIYSLISILNSTWDSSEGSLSAVTHFINNAVSAALYFGNLDLLQPELQLMEGFLINRQYRQEQIVDFWHRYTDSIKKVLGQEAAPLMNWFDLYISKQEMQGEVPQQISH